MRVLLIAVLVALAGCADLSPQSRWQHADQLAAEAGWQKLRIPTDTFILSAYVPHPVTRADTLTVYIEGDGMAWLNRHTPSSDPTPRHPVGLELALRHTQGVAAYLARPCQYAEAADAKGCRQAFWTNRRFAPEVIEASDRAIPRLKQHFTAKKMILVGYSGGGAVAALVAARRTDVIRLVTVAGNLDHRIWTQMHRVPALDGSLNPADESAALADLPQRHFIGGKDKVVGHQVAEAYAARFPPGKRPQLITLPDFDHACCWVAQWAALWRAAGD